MIGKTLGHYRVIQELGRGGMGEVYVADDLNLNRKVALKFLPDTFAGDSERMARFEREAKLLASLNHPNIAAIYGLEQAEGKRFIVMELVEGESLAQRLSKGALPIEEALQLCRQIADGLEAAHEKGVIHRDLKPANVMITEGDKVKILDFGLAKALSGETQNVNASQSPTITEAMTQPGVILGTAAYMSPEQAKGKAVDKRADIWAFGCILYECLTGKRVFEGDTVTETLAAVLTREPEWDKVPASVHPLLLRCLEKDSKKRLRDVGEAMAWVEIVPQAAPVKRPWLWIGATALLLAAYVALFFIHFHEKPGALPEPARFQIELPADANLGMFPTLALSPDGRFLAFAGFDSAGVSRVWLRAIDSLETRPLSGTDSTSLVPHPFWSADSRFIAFDAGGKLRRIAVAGGPAQAICDLSGTIAGGSWNRNDIIIFSEYSGSGAIFSVSAAGGTPSLLTRPNPKRQEIRHSYPVFLPDGRHFLFLCEANAPEIAGVYIGSLDLKPEEQDTKRLIAASGTISYLPPGASNPGLLLFPQGQTLMAQRFDDKKLKLIDESVSIVESVGSLFLEKFFSVSTNGILVYRPKVDNRLTWVDRSGLELGTIAELGDYGTFNLSKDAGKVVVSKSGTDGHWNLWIVDLRRGSTTRLTQEKADHTDPRWSPDGSRVTFGSTRDPSRSPFQVTLPSSDPVQAFKFDGRMFSLDDWSPDGRFLLYHDSDLPGLWAIPLSEERKPQLVTRSLSGIVDQSRFSPDGRWIAYNTDESGRHEVKVVPFPPTGEKWQISTEGGAQAMWGRDGKELYFLTPDGTLMAVDIRAGKTLEWGKPHALFKSQIFVSYYMEQYAPAPDGNRFLFVKPAPGTSRAPFEVYLNWTALFKK
jgi:eukaryotic-like serine/threonine-protein kinase